MTTEWNGTPPNAHDPLTGVYHGDCRHYLSVLDVGSAPLIFSDPPFNVNYEYDVYQDNRSAQEYLDWTREWGREVVRVLAPDGTFWLAIGDEFAAELKMIFHREIGLILRSWVVWYFTFGVNSPKKLTRSHVHLFYFVKDPKRFHFDVDAIKVPSARQLVYNDKRAQAGGRLPDDTWILRPQDAEALGAFEPTDDVWHVPRVCGTYRERAGWHGCQMPEAVLGRIIRACSKPGDLVCDPFAGSGTTAAVAKKLGRKWLTFELSAEYAARARERVDAAKVGEPLSGEAIYRPGKSSKAAPTSNLFD
jgi:DNA modification methylase